MMNKKAIPHEKMLVADWQVLMRTFIRPENDTAQKTLIKYMEQIFFGLHDFLNKYVGFTEEISLKELADRFTGTLINKNPDKKLSDVIFDPVEDIAPHAVNAASPYFVGHMTYICHSFFYGPFKNSCDGRESKRCKA